MRKGLITAIGAISLATMTLSGCKAIREYNQRQDAQKEIDASKPQNYFARIPIISQSSMMGISGDFNKDGNLDIVVGVGNYDSYFGYVAKLYFFKGDGKGNFTMDELHKPINISK